jgi:hypothetical protein
MFRLKSIAFVAMISILACCACNSTQKDPNSSTKKISSVDSLYELVIAKHDTVMPKIANLEGLQQKLRKNLDALPEAKSSFVQKDTIVNLLSDLQKGHDAMFDWMGAFKNKYSHEEFYKNSHESELINYLKSEETKVEEVARLMLGSMERAEMFLKK